MAAPEEREVFDRLSLIDRLENDDELMLELIDLYVEDGAQQLARLGAAIRSGDVEATQRVAHSIKGASGNVCAPQVADLARSIERVAGSGSLAGAEERLAELRVAFERFAHVVSSAGLLPARR